MRLHLHRAAADNANSFVDAGRDIEVGNEPEQIGEHRALELLSGGGAIDPDEPAADVLDLAAEQLAHDVSIEATGVDEFGVENEGR